MKLSRITALIVKEFLAILHDKKSRRVVFFPPIIQLFLFAFAATLDVKDVPIGILNKDTGHHAIELTQRFIGSPTFSKIIYLQSVEEITPFIDTKKGAVVVHIDEQFSRTIDEGKVAPVQLILDGRKSNTAQIIGGYVGVIIDQFNQDLLLKKSSVIEPTELVVRHLYNPNLLYYWFTIPSLCGILTMVEALILTAMSIARERELGTFDQLLVSPLQPLEILIGKVIPPMCISMLAGTFILIAGTQIFRVPFAGSLLPLYISMFIFVSSIVGIGLMVSSLCATQQQAILGSSVILSPSISLSGFATPIENMPEWLQKVTYLIPLRYFLVITKGLFLKAMPLAIVFQNMWPMILIAIFTLSMATVFFRRSNT